MGGPAEAHSSRAEAVHRHGRAIGQVFAVALDNETPLPTSMPRRAPPTASDRRFGPDGQPRHVKMGAPNARLHARPVGWGGAELGESGSIWKIDGATGQSSLLANVALDGVANSGPALGGLAFDPDFNSLFVADRKTGLIHRFGLDGRERGRLTTALPRAARPRGCRRYRSDANRRPSNHKPQFDSADPVDLELCAAGATRLRPRRLPCDASITRWPPACRSGRSDSTAEGPSAMTPLSRFRRRRPTGPPKSRKSPSTSAADVSGRAARADWRLRFRGVDVPADRPCLRYAISVLSLVGGVWQQIPDEDAIGFPCRYATQWRRRDRLPLRRSRRLERRLLRRLPVGHRRGLRVPPTRSWSRGCDSPDPQLSTACKAIAPSWCGRRTRRR